MEYRFFIGIDVSKEHLDLALLVTIQLGNSFEASAVAGATRTERGSVKGPVGTNARGGQLTHWQLLLRKQLANHSG